MLHTKFQAPEPSHVQVILKKKIFEYFSMYFYGLNLGPTRQCYIPKFKYLSQAVLKKKFF